MMERLMERTHWLKTRFPRGSSTSYLFVFHCSISHITQFEFRNQGLMGARMWNNGTKCP